MVREWSGGEFGSCLRSIERGHGGARGRGSGWG